VWWIIGTTVIVAAAALGYSMLETKLYTATTTIQVQGSKTGGGNASAAQVQSDVEIAGSPLIKGLVVSHLKLPGGSGLRLSSAAEGANQDLFTISAAAPSPTAAATDANTAFEEFQSFEKGLAITSDSLLQISPALPPAGPSSPKTLRNVALGLIVGLILGLILAFALDAFDDSIKSEEDIAKAYPGLPNLGLIPIVETWKDAAAPYLVALRNPSSQATEAYRSLRTATEFARVNRSVRSIVVTSSMDFEGKTATVANLGVAFAKAGQRTLVVSADLRRPRNFFGFSDKVGLASVALGSATFDEAIEPVVEVPGLSYLGTGPLPAEAAEFLSSHKVEEIFRVLRDRFDLVLIDTPPAVLVTDALVMSRYVDAVIVVVAHGRTRRRSLARVRELCLQVNAPVLGTVLNGVATKGADAYRHGYGYRYGYRRGYGDGYGYGQSAAAGSQPRQDMRIGRRSSKQQSNNGSAQPESVPQSSLDVETEHTGS
jgi:capsular exopolysaccharide synthesis family protein